MKSTLLQTYQCGRRIAVAVMVMLLAVLLAGGLSACAQQQRLDAVLGDVAEKRDEIDTAYLRWGSVEMFMEEPAQIEQLWQELQQLQVQEEPQPQINQAAHTIIFTDEEAPDWLGGVAWNTDCTEMWLIGTEYEANTYWQSNEPEQVQQLLAQFCSDAREEWSHTTIYADLTGDGQVEWLVTNPAKGFSVYTEDGKTLHSSDWVDFYGSYHLCRLEEEQYGLLYYAPPYVLPAGTDNYITSWQLWTFDEAGTGVETAHGELSFTLADLQDEAENVVQFLQTINGYLDDSCLLYADDGAGTQRYSTVEQRVQQQEETTSGWLKNLTV